MNSLKQFNTEPFIASLKSFFKELDIPVNYLSDSPAAAADILGDKFKPKNEAHSLIEEVYALGMVDDAIFEGKESFKDIEAVKKINRDYDGLLIFGVMLKEKKDRLLPTRSQLAEITRAFNRAFPYTPATIVFKYQHYISFANSERIKYKQEWREGEKAGRVTMLKDVDTNNTHAAHLKILSGLTINQQKINSFNKLYNYWQSVFSLQVLNNQFYADLQDWFYYASQNIKLPYKPDHISEKENIKNFLVRLLARTIFCWFVKEKGLINPELLELTDWQGNKFPLTNDIDDKNFLFNNSYYRGILQNIFFRALNQKDKKSLKDFAWRKYLNTNFKFEWFIKIPYLNGGIFDELKIEDNAKESTEDTVIKIPNFLFYGIEKKEKTTTGSGARARTESQLVEHKGLNAILKSYKFTLDENTPFEEDIALDPEMLGLVFENLLAELDTNLEENTLKSIRKMTGSYYTPRKIIHEMVNDSLYLYLNNFISNKYPDIKNFKKDISDLVYFNNLDETNSVFCKAVVHALDQFKMLDPACGSGAFPMGMLHRMVDILKLVDSKNEKWIELKLKNVDAAQRNDFKKVLTTHLDDYGRKLGIIRDSIYGIDIQPMAVQITKLRFFISLLIDQKEAKGIAPMPNIETKIVCADSLKDVKVDMHSLAAIDRLTEVRRRYYQPEISPKDRQIIADEIIDALDVAFPSFAFQITGKRVAGQNKIFLRDWFTHGTLAAPFFNMDFFFPELKKTGGFDCVIGNPPYGGSKITDDVRNTLQIESKDPYGAFIARFLNRYDQLTPLKHGGVLAFIASDTFMTIKSHLKLRRLLMQNYVHKMIRVNPDTFHATVNTVVMIAERNTKKEINDKHICLMADMTNISIHENYEHFVEVLNQTKGVDFNTAKASILKEEYAMYCYPQALIKANNNLPFFVASPKLFALMNDSSKDLKKELKEIGGKPVQVRKININGKEIQVVKLGDVGAAPHGISTGDNKKYVRVKHGIKGSYELVEDWMICTSEEVLNLSNDEKIFGLNKEWTGLKECFVPFEKGGESDSNDGWLPNYYVPTQYYINWAKGAILDMRKNPGVAWKNERYFFKKGLTFSISGVYAPTFRLNSGGVFEAKGSGLFCDLIQDELLLSIISSKLAKFIFKNFIKHSVDTSGDDIASFSLIINLKSLDRALIDNTNRIIQSQKSNPRYDYASHEQLEIDKLVYEAYGLNREDVQEVENWYARRYPKLSAAQKANLRALGKSDDYLELYGLK